MIIVDFLRWFFSNSGATARGFETLDPKTVGFFGKFTKQTLRKRHCPYCDIVYWAFTKGNSYCGRFACFRKMVKRVESF